MSERTVSKINQLGEVSRGRSRHRPRNDASLYGGAYPFFQTGDVKSSGLYMHAYTQTYNEKGLSQSRLWQPGTLCITIAANIAETSILAIEGCFPDSIVGFVANDERCDVRYIKYYIDTIKLSLQNVSRGTTQDNLSVDKLLAFNFHLPPVQEQRRIASILSTYDDLIENNTRRIAILEEMAQAIYREWFVHFRYPGHEDVPLVDSPLGPIPEGWSVSSVRDLAVMHRQSVTPSLSPDTLYQHYSLPAFDDSQVPVVEAGSGIRSNKYVVPPGSVLVSKLNPRIPRVWLPSPSEDLPAIASTEFMVMLPASDELRAFLYSTFVSPEFGETLASFAVGTSTSHQRVKPSDFLSMLVVMPDEQILRTHSTSAVDMYRLIETQRSRNALLQKTRDLLLPRLISGQIDVSVDVSVEELQAQLVP